MLILERLTVAYIESLVAMIESNNVPLFLRARAERMPFKLSKLRQDRKEGKIKKLRGYLL